MCDVASQAPQLQDASTEERIQGALLELLHEHPLADISVKELCARAYVARSTFYAHYHNVAEVLEQIEDTLVADLTALNAPLADGSRSDPDDLAFFRNTVAYIEDHRDVMEILLVERPSVRFIKAWKEAIKGHLRARKPLSEASSNGLALELVASTMVSASTYLISEEGPVDIDRICEMVSDVLDVMERWT